MAASLNVEALIENTGSPLSVLLHVKWLGSNKPFTTTVIDVYAPSHVDGASQAVMLQQKLAPLMPKPLVWYGQVCMCTESGAPLTMRPSDFTDYLNAFEHSLRPPKTAAQTKLDKAWDALAKDALHARAPSSAVPVPASVTLFATQYSSTDAAIARLQIKSRKVKDQFAHDALFQAKKNKLDFYSSLDRATKDNPRVVLCCFEQGIWSVNFSGKVNESVRVVLTRLSRFDFGKSQYFASVPDHVLQNKDVTAAILKQNKWDPECFAKYNLLKCEELQKYAQVMFDVKRRKLHKPANTFSRNDVLERVRMNGNALKLHVAYTDDKEVVLAAATCKRKKLSYRFLAWLEPCGRNDEDVVYAALQNGASIEGASIRLQGNLRCARVAVAHTGLDLEHLSDKLRKHRGLVLAACKQNGLALRYAHAAFKDDEEVVLVACRSCAEAVQFVSPRLRKSERVFLAACSSLKPGSYYSYPSSFRTYATEFSDSLRTTAPSNKVAKQLIEKSLVCRNLWDFAKPLVTKSTVMWFIKSKLDLAVTFFNKHGIEKNLDFACKCVSSNWELFGSLHHHSLQISDHQKERLRSAAFAGFGPAKAAAAFWMADDA